MTFYKESFVGGWDSNENVLVRRRPLADKNETTLQKWSVDRLLIDNRQFYRHYMRIA